MKTTPLPPYQGASDLRRQPRFPPYQGVADGHRFGLMGFNHDGLYYN